MTKPIRSKYLEDAPVKDYVKEMLKHVALEDLQRKFEVAYADQIKKLFEDPKMEYYREWDRQFDEDRARV